MAYAPRPKSQLLRSWGITLWPTPFTPTVPVGERSPRNPQACQLCPSWYPAWLWSPQPWLQTYGNLTLPAQDVTVGRQWCRVQALICGILQSMPLPFPSLGPLAVVQRGSYSPDMGPRSLFLKPVGSASPGPGVHYSPISGGSQSPWHPGSVFHPSFLNLRVNLTKQDGEWQWVTRLPGTNQLPRYYVLFVFINAVPLGCFY